MAIAQAKIDQAKAEAAQLEAQLAQTQIVAPFDGVVANVLIDAHQFVGPGTPIVQVADLNGLRVETNDLSENDVARIQVGDTAQVQLRRPARCKSRRHSGTPRSQSQGRRRRQLHCRYSTRSDPRGAALGHDGQCRHQRERNERSSESSAAAVNDGRRHINATGKALPANKAVLSAALPGQVVELRVDVGTPVKKGDVIARLDTSVLDAEVAKAEAGLALAQANLDRVKAGARPEQILEARSALSATQASVTQASANRDEVKKGATQAEIDQARAAVQQAYIAMVDARTKRDVLDQRS